jgi:cytochrome c556
MNFLFLIITTLFMNNSFAQMDHNMMSSSMSSDTRKPLPLTAMMAEHQKQNMREHLEAIRDLTAAFVSKNFKKIEEAGRKLGTSPQMKMMCDHMGKGAPGFTEMALKMHSEADKIVFAAQKKDFNGAMVATNRTLQSCTSCHAVFKQEILSEEDWKKRTTVK